MVEEPFISPLKLTYLIGYVYILSALFLILTSLVPQLTEKLGAIVFLDMIVMFWSSVFGVLALFCTLITFSVSKQKPPLKFWWMLAVVAVISLIILRWM